MIPLPALTSQGILGVHKVRHIWLTLTVPLPLKIGCLVWVPWQMVHRGPLSLVDANADLAHHEGVVTLSHFLLSTKEPLLSNAHVCDGLSKACHSAHEDIPQLCYNHHQIQTILQSPSLLLHPSKLDGDEPISQDQLIWVLNLSKHSAAPRTSCNSWCFCQTLVPRFLQSYSSFFGNINCRCWCSYCWCDGQHCTQQPLDVKACIKYAFGYPGFFIGLHSGIFGSRNIQELQF